MISFILESGFKDQCHNLESTHHPKRILPRVQCDYARDMGCVVWLGLAFVDKDRRRGLLYMLNIFGQVVRLYWDCLFICYTV